MKKTNSGFAHVEILLAVIIVLLLALGGYYVYTTQVQLRSSKPSTTQDSKNSEKPTQISTASPRAFYDCVNANGSVTDNAPFTCTLDGSTFDVPTVFDKSQINNLDKVPTNLQPQIITLAKQNFDSCKGDVPGYPDMTVSLAQANFVDVGFGCGVGAHTFFGLNGSTWTNLGSNQQGLKCSWVSTYQIHQSSIVTHVGSAGDVSCYNSDGSGGQVPQ